MRIHQQTPHLVTAAPFGRCEFIYALKKNGLTNSLELCLDAGDDASYSSGQSWLDTSGNGYDFFLGATGSAEGSDPTFIGTAGKLSSGEYWSHDGGDYFRYDTTNETWMDNIHQEGAQFTLVGFYYIASTASQNFFAGTGGGGATNKGIDWGLNTSGQIICNIRNTVANALSELSTATVSAGTWHMIGLSLDENGGSSAGIHFISGTTETFDPSYTSPATGAATYTMEIGSRGNANTPLTNTSRLGLFAAWSRPLSTTELDRVFAITRGRYGI